MEEHLCFSVFREEVRKCITKLSPVSGAGHGDSTPQHLKDLFANYFVAVANDLLDALCRLFNETVLSGAIHEDIRSTFLESNTICIVKR